MPRGPSKGSQRMAPHTRAALPLIDGAIAKGWYEVEIPVTGLKSVEEAESWRKGIHNSATLAGASAHTTAVKGEDGRYTFQQDDDETYRFSFVLHKKTAGRKHILEKHGTDRSQWPYDPRQPSPRDENGRRTDV